MFRFTIRELVLMVIAAAVTAVGMYAAWQADRAVLALRLSQLHVRASRAEGELSMHQRHLPAPPSGAMAVGGPFNIPPDATPPTEPVQFKVLTKQAAETSPLFPKE